MPMTENPLSLLHHAAALQPSGLSEDTQSAIDALMQEGESANTVASYRAAMRYWAAWTA